MLGAYPVLSLFNMNQSTAKIAALASVAAVGALSVFLLYSHRETVREVLECALYEKDKATALSDLRRIRAASVAFEKELDETEKKAFDCKIKSIPFDSATRNSIIGLSTDFDFVLASLDKVEGDAYVKAERKKLVECFKAFVGRVDALADLVK